MKNIVLLSMMLISFSVFSENIPAGRYTIWNPGIPGGIPEVTAIHTVIDAATYGNGITDAASAINKAIQAAGNVYDSTGICQVVFLPAGTYRVSGSIRLNRSGVVLRGENPELTRIMSGAEWGIEFGRIWPAYPTGVFDVLEDALKGSSALVVSNSSAADINVGDILQIDQQDPEAVEVIPGELWMNGYVWLYNGIYHKRQPSEDTNGPGTGGIPGSGNANYDARYTGPWRSVCQQVEIVSKTAGAARTVLGLAGPLHIDFQVSRMPQLFHTGSEYKPARDNMPGIQYSGLENFCITGSDGQAVFGWNLAFCWIRGIEVDGEMISGDPAHPGVGGEGVDLSHAYRCVIRDSYIHHSRRMINNAGSYGIVLNQSSECLIENNIAMWYCKPVMFNVSGGGNVVGYNYVDQAVIIGVDWQEGAIDLCHQSFSHSDLVEGNWTVNMGTDSTHGNSGWMTYFRNYASGRNSFPYQIEGTIRLPSGNLRAVYADALTRESSFIGNVLHGADSGRGLFYECNYDFHPYGASSVYSFGNFYREETGAYDYGMAASLACRHGNWDNVNNKIIWDASNPDHNIPDSLYLGSKPSFFGNLPWPWVDPFTGTVYTLPAKARFEEYTSGNRR